MFNSTESSASASLFDLSGTPVASEKDEGFEGFKMPQCRALRILLVMAGLLLAGCVMPTDQAVNSADETLQVAEASYSIGDYAEAARLYEVAVSRNPNSVPALIGLGKSYTALAQFSRANNALLSALQLNGRNPEVHNQLGNMALMELHPKQAIDHFDAALRLDRNNLSALTGKSVSLDYLSRHAEAQEVYRKALKLTSLTNLSSIAGPLGFTALYSATVGAWNGWVWIFGAILYLICLPILRRPFATSL